MRERTTKTSLITAALITCFFIISGCAGVGWKYESPQVTLSDIRLTSIKVFEQQYRITLRIQNPNSTALKIRGIAFRLDVNDSQFLQGSSKQQVTVPAFGDALIEADVFSSLFNILDQIRGLDQNGVGPLKYRLSGKAYIVGSPVPLSFEKEGSVGSLKGNNNG